MRVIAGEARGRPLQAPKGAATRPTSDKVKGALFSMLESLLLRSGDAGAATGDGVWAGKRVLDLYAGSGALGIEALSRGAAAATLVEQDRAARAAIEVNLRATGFAARVRVRPQSVAAYLRGATAGGEGCDIILADPPYADPGIEGTLASLAVSPLVTPCSVLVVEHARQVGLAERYGDLTRVRERRHGDTVISCWLGSARLAAWQSVDGAAAEPADEEE